MSDRAESTLTTQLADWTEDGIYRAAYLGLFDPTDRAILRRAGIILATQAISGDVADEPVVIAHLHCAIEDARMLAVFLQEISEKAQDDLDTDRAENLAALADVWSRDVAAIVSAMEEAIRSGDEMS